MMKRIFLLLLIAVLAAPEFVQGQVVNIEAKRLDADEPGWSGSLDFLLTLTKTVNRVMQVEGKSQLQWQKKKHRVLLLNDWTLIRAEGADLVNKGYSHLRYNYQWTPLVTWEAFTQGQFNQIQKQQFRALAGTGPRFRIVEQDSFGLYLGTLYMYEYEELAENLGVGHFNRMSSYISVNYIATKVLAVDHITYYQPVLTNFSDFRISTESVLALALTKYVTFKVSFNLIYDSLPPPDVPNVSYELTNGIGFQF